MAEVPSYEIVLIPKLTENDANINQLAEKSRAFRLHALKESPDAFAVTYEIESQRGLDHSIQRLVNLKAAQFVALRKAGQAGRVEADGNAMRRLLRDEWVGFIVLMGPEEGNELSVPSANLDPFGRMTATSAMGSSGEAKDMHYHLNGMFVDPRTRGGGVGKVLIDTAVRRAEMEANRAGKPLRLTLSVFGDNVAARHLYTKAGFEVVEEAESRSRPGLRVFHMQLREATSQENELCST